MMTPQPPPVFVVTGMKVGCMPFHALSGGTLECFYDPVCFNTTAEWISSLPQAEWPQPLNSFLPSKYLPNTSISYILNQQMVERWNIVTNFTGYYTACSPIQCTYKLTKRSDFIYVLTTLIGSFGGLIVVLRIASPLIIQLRNYLRDYLSKKTHRSVALQDPQPGIYDRIYK